MSLKKYDSEEQNLFRIIKAHGYKVTSDKMGTYFNNGDKKFSIIKIGDIYNCYYNKKVSERDYELKESFLSQILMKQCLFWIVNNLNKKD
jgi:hypothetical protein